MQSKAKTVEQYLAELPEDRRAALQAVREVILKNLDKDYEEGMGYGMMGYYVPHRIFPAGYHCDPKQPLAFAGLASQKNYMSIYLMCNCGDEAYQTWFQKAWAKSGKKQNMGKSCIRFTKIEDIPLDVIGEAIRRVPAKKYIAFYEKALEDMRSGKTQRVFSEKVAVKKAPAKKTAKKKRPAAGRGASR